jgi:hypothetical protein
LRSPAISFNAARRSGGGGYGLGNRWAKGPPRVQLYDNAIVDRLAQEGFIDKLYKGAKP